MITAARLLPVSEFQAGDILAFSGVDFTAQVIRWGTLSIFSHVGVCVFDPALNQTVYCESTTLNELPCIYGSKPIAGVQFHYPREVVNQFNGRVWLYRLTDALDDYENAKLFRYLSLRNGRPYDYLQAVVSGGRLMKWLIRDKGDALFCSELVAGAMRRICRFPLRPVSGVNPRDLIGMMTRRAQIYKVRRVK